MRFVAILLLAPSSLNAAESTGRAAVRQQIEQRSGRNLRDQPSPPRSRYSLPPGIALPDDRLTADDAVSLALWNNASFEASLAALGIARADLLDAGLWKNPNFQNLIPVGGKPFEFLLNWPIEDLWQRKQRVLAAQQNLDSITAGLVQNGLNLIRDVKAAHADLWLAERRAGTLRESAALRLRIATLTERRKEAGDATGLDVSVAWSDARSAEELAQRAGGDIEIARARLNLLVGFRDQPRAFTAVARPDPWPAFAAAEQLVESAYAGRPDLRAAELGIEASAYRAKWQRRRIFNMLWPMLSIKKSGSPLLVRSGPGLNMEIPIFHRNQGQIARADAEVVQAAWRYAALRDQVEAEVRDARARLEQARASRDLLRLQVRPLVEQAITQSETAFRNGDASFLNVLETTRQKFDSLLREYDAEAALARAYAELERSVGKRL